MSPCSGFASYCLTLASLPTYAVQGGARESTAGIVTAVLLVVTIAVQAVVPALTARFGQAARAGDRAGRARCAVPAVRRRRRAAVALGPLGRSAGIGFAVLTVLGATLAAQVAPLERRGEAIGIYGLSIAVPNLIAVPAGVALVLDGHAGWLAWLAASPLLGLVLVPTLVRAMPPAEVQGSGGWPAGPRRWPR